MDANDANDDDAAPARWRPFFRIAGSGYGVDDASSPEWRQLNHGWQKDWTIEDDPQRAHERSKNPVCVYDLSHAERNCADLAARCELATDGIACFSDPPLFFLSHEPRNISRNENDGS